MRRLILLFIYLTATFITVNGQNGVPMPSINFLDMNGNSITNANFQATQGMFVYFDPLCDACEAEINTIKSHSKFFQDKPIYLISPGKVEDVDQFIKKNKLDNYPFIKVIQDKDDLFYKLFKTNGYPSIFIFNNKNIITANFSGEIPFDNLKNAFKVQSNPDFKNSDVASIGNL